MTINKRYRCKECNKFFVDTDYYEEKHGLDSPPYERIPICPHCKSDNFIIFDFKMDKFELAQKILPVISDINRYFDSLSSIYGTNCKNENLKNAADTLCELMNEMFCYISSSMEKKILNCSTYGDEEMILMYLKGEV